MYPDYAAPIAWADGDLLGVVKAVFGFWPKFMQPERVDDNGKKRRKLDTVNARSETVGESRLYGKAWRAGQRCLIPARWIYEPCYETGRNVWHRIGLADWQSYCVAGIWRRYDGDDGRTLVGMSMLTVNAEGHAAGWGVCTSPATKSGLWSFCGQPTTTNGCILRILRPRVRCFNSIRQMRWLCSQSSFGCRM